MADQEWLRVRAYLKTNRYALSVDASRTLYPDVARVCGTPLLAALDWIPEVPVDLDDIRLTLDVHAPRPSSPGQPDLVPYSERMRSLARPAVFENRSTYRLTKACLRGRDPFLAFGMGRYFDTIDHGEAAAHEFAAAASTGSPLSRRTALGDPVDLSARPVNVAISTVTIRHDRATGDARFLLHWRDPRKVGHAGGLYQVIPVGVFQPATDHPQSVDNDFSLWRCLVREFAEELLGEAENTPDAGPIDYARWPFAARLDQERARGSVAVSCVGLGTDPLSLVTDLLCVAVVDAAVFDDVFGSLTTLNDEGRLVDGPDGRAGFPFTAGEVGRLTTDEPMQAAGAAALALAWRHRDTLLG